MFANYQIVITDIESGNVVNILDTSQIQSLSYVRSLNNIGTFQLSVSNELNIEYKLDNIVDIYRDNGNGYELEDSYLIRDYSSDESQIDILSGVHLNHLLKRRQIIPDDDPLGAGGFSSKSGFADTVMAEYVTDNCISPALNNLRIIPNLSANTPTNDDAYLTFQRRNQENNLLEVLQEIAEQGNCDFLVTHLGNSNFLFTAEKIGNDYTARRGLLLAQKKLFFSESFANLISPEFEILRKDEITVALVGGQGIESDKEYITITSDRFLDSPLNRIEATTQASGENTTQLVANAKTFLTEQSAKTEFTFELNPDIANTIYKTDYDLGDYVTAQYKTYQFDYRIMEISIDISDSGENIRNKLMIRNDNI